LSSETIPLEELESYNAKTTMQTSTNRKYNMTVELFNQEFEGIAGQLKSYILRITASIADAEDIVHDTYLKALDKLHTFRGDSSLKTWLFTIASNLAKDNLRAQKRWTENVTDITKEAALNNRQFFQEAMHIRMTSPSGHYEAKEHIAFCFTCISKSLPLEQQLCLFLKEVYEFKVSEITTILGTTEAMVKYYLHTGRSKMINIFDGRCALINKEGVCYQCSELNGIFNPKQNTQEELMKIDLVKEAEKEDKEYLFDLRMQILRDIDPFKSKASELQLHHLEHNRMVMEKYLEKTAD
jgi:RNA polymerase sigma-70 factor (ECF subfamily)